MPPESTSQTLGEHCEERLREQLEQMRLSALTLASVYLLAGCTISSEPDRSTDSTACAQGTTAPIDEKALTRAFSAEGITLRRDDRCSSLPGVLVSLSSSNDEEIDVLCELYTRDATQDNRIERFVWLNDPTPTHLRVLNVVCGVFAKQTTETDVVERAFRRLPRVSAAPTTVPSEDAVHD
jgi:hypothetical protein